MGLIPAYSGGNVSEIRVLKDGATVFHAVGGRLGREDSARWDFLCFASGVIGASYTVVDDAIKRIKTMGYETSVGSGVS